MGSRRMKQSERLSVRESQSLLIFGASSGDLRPFARARNLDEYG